MDTWVELYTMEELLETAIPHVEANAQDHMPQIVMDVMFTLTSMMDTVDVRMAGTDMIAQLACLIGLCTILEHAMEPVMDSAMVQKLVIVISVTLTLTLTIGDIVPVTMDTMVTTVACIIILLFIPVIVIPCVVEAAGDLICTTVRLVSVTHTWTHMDTVCASLDIMETIVTRHNLLFTTIHRT
jgi:hypothetical protein